MVFYTHYDSPVGRLLLESDGRALTGLWMNREWNAADADIPILEQAKAWLDAYFRGDVPGVEVPMAPAGTEFQRSVWDILREIPFGQTRTYGDIAREMAARLGKDAMSAQAVGGAVGRNPISILIPCHRVIGARGQLTGYAGGLDKKVWLLRHEGWL